MLRWLALLEDPRTLGLLRIAFGVLLVANVWALWPHRIYLYSEAGVLPTGEVCHGLHHVSAMCLVPGTTGVVLVFAVFSLFALAFVVGLHTGIAKWGTAYLFASIVLRNPLPLAGEQVFGNFLFLLCLSRCGAAYSFDNLRRRRGEGEPRYRAIPAWPRHLMILQLCIAYGVAGWAKTGAGWNEGTAFYYVLANDRWFRFEPWWLLSTFGTNVLNVATWGAWWFERLFPLVGLRLLLGARVRPLRWIGSRWIWAPLAVVFAGTLTILMNIGWFVPAMLAATLVLFRGDEVGRIVARLRRRPFVPARVEPSARSGARLHHGVLASFVVWHGGTMLVNALSLPHLRLPVPDAVRRVAWTWGRVTNTFQFWGMFSPDVPRRRAWLLVDVVAPGGDVIATFDDRALLGRRRYPYVGLDRRQKVHANIRSRWQQHAEHHARFVCRNWRDSELRPPAAVVIGMWSWPLPDPRWLAAHGPADPRPAGERYRRARELMRLPCGG